MGKPSGPELQLKKWLWTCLTWPTSQFYPGFQWARLIQTYRTTCGLWLEHSAHWAIGSITWATLSPSGQFGSPSIQRWQTIADHLPCTARIISRTGYVKYITALRLSALWVRQSSNARATLKLTINHLVGWALARLLEWWGWNNAVYKHRHVATSGWSYFDKGNPFARNCQTEKHMRQNHPKPSQTYNSCKTVSAWHISIPRCSGYFKGTPGSTKQLVSHGASLASRPMSDWRADAYSSRIRNQIMRISNHQRHYMSLLSTQWI